MIANKIKNLILNIDEGLDIVLESHELKRGNKCCLVQKGFEVH